MWTEEKLKEAAREWSNNPDLNMEWWKGERYCSFLAGCKYIINNTQKEK